MENTKSITDTFCSHIHVRMSHLFPFRAARSCHVPLLYTVLLSFTACLSVCMFHADIFNAFEAAERASITDALREYFRYVPRLVTLCVSDMDTIPSYRLGFDTEEDVCVSNAWRTAHWIVQPGNVCLCAHHDR